MPSYVVTGAARGIGLEFVRQLGAKQGNIVFALVRSKSNSSKLADLHGVHVLEADITDCVALKKSANYVSEKTGGTLDCLINNAASSAEERSHLTLDGYAEGEEELLAKDIQSAFNVNVIGTIHTTNAFLPLLRKGTLKRVMTLSSVIGDLDYTRATGLSIMNPYCISKAALNMVVAKYAAQYKIEGIIFVSVSPGLIDTRSDRVTEWTDVDAYKVGIVLEAFKRGSPHWDGSVQTPQQAVCCMLEMLEEFTIEQSGAFLPHKGSRDWL